jgi:hypothetical protein
MTKYFVTSDINLKQGINGATASKKNLQFIKTNELEMDGITMTLGVSHIGYNKEGRKIRSKKHEYTYYYYLIVQDLAITCTRMRYPNYTQERSTELALEYFAGDFTSILKQINLEVVIEKVADWKV